MSRTWTLELPPGTPFLTANNRDHWSARQRTTANLHACIKTLVVMHKVPAIERADITVQYEPPPRLKRDRGFMASPRVEDQDNLAPAAKALVDGLVQAGVLPGDSRKRVRSSTELLADTNPRGLLRVVITEVTDG